MTVDRSLARPDNRSRRWRTDHRHHIERQFKMSCVTRRKWLLMLGLLAGACRDAQRSTAAPEAPAMATVTLVIDGMV
jgi:hypothetical protein